MEEITITEKNTEMDYLDIYSQIKTLCESCDRILNDAETHTGHFVHLSFYKRTEQKKFQFMVMWTVERDFYNNHLRDELFLNNQIAQRIRAREDHNGTKQFSRLKCTDEVIIR